MTAAGFLRSLAEVSRADLGLVGGKAASLGDIASSGVRVPPGFVVTREGAEAWRAGTLPELFDSSVLAACSEVGARRFAVRSSGVLEDGETASWAGQFETYLGVAPADVPRRVRDCWQSPGAQHASQYATLQDASDERWDIAVVVQEMVASDVSGVLFTVDPVSSRPGVCSLEAIAGLGELLVQGQVTPLSCVVDRASGAVVERHEHRQRRALRLSDEGVREVALEEGFEISMPQSLIDELVSVGLSLEDLFGRPQDIEWAVADGCLYIVQSRAITTIVT